MTELRKVPVVDGVSTVKVILKLDEPLRQEALSKGGPKDLDYQSAKRRME